MCPHLPILWFVRSTGAEPLTPANRRATRRISPPGWPLRRRRRARLRYDGPHRQVRSPCVSHSARSFTVPLQSFKRKPGQADNERSTGDYNERVNKRLRTVERSTERAEERNRSDAKQESDLYEHIEQGESAYDAQTYGR